MYEAPRIIPCGDSAASVEFGQEIETAASDLVLGLDREVSRHRIHGVLETVPTYRSLLVHYDPLKTSFDTLVSELLEHCDLNTGPVTTNRVWEVPVFYGGEHGVDLHDLADLHGISPEALVERHTFADYRVCMIGFMPGFAYLSGLDEKLHTPRRRDPRPNAPPGTISIGGQQTALQSVEGPSGWHWIGRTPLEVFSPTRRPMCLMEPGDIIRFSAISAGAWNAAHDRCVSLVEDAIR
ncbi:MAG: 5-oxoprolinase subunit PxpB [Pseudomonadota bacterium]